MTTTEHSAGRVAGPAFPKKYRLRAAPEFRAVYADGLRKTSRSFVAFVKPNGMPVSRFGLTTPRKLGKAHERNRIRRRVREILRKERPRLPAGRDIVLNPRRSVLLRDWEALRAELVSLLEPDRDD